MARTSKTSTTIAAFEIEGLEALTSTEAKSVNGGSWYGNFCAGIGTFVAICSGNQRYGVNTAKFFYGNWGF